MAKSKKVKTSCCFVCLFCFCCSYWSVNSMENNQQSPGSIHTLPPPPPPLMKGVEIPRGRGLLRERSGNNTRWTDIHCVTTKTLCLHSTLFCNLSSWLKIQVCYLISSLYSCNSWSLLSLSVLVCKQALHLWLLVNSPNWELDRGLKLSWITHFIRLFSLLFSLQLFRVGPIPSPFLL